MCSLLNFLDGNSDFDSTEQLSKASPTPIRMCGLYEGLIYTSLYRQGS